VRAPFFLVALTLAIPHSVAIATQPAEFAPYEQLGVVDPGLADEPPTEHSLDSPVPPRVSHQERASDRPQLPPDRGIPSSEDPDTTHQGHLNTEPEPATELERVETSASVSTLMVILYVFLLNVALAALLIIRKVVVSRIGPAGTKAVADQASLAEENTGPGGTPGEGLREEESSLTSPHEQPNEAVNDVSGEEPEEQDAPV